MHAAWRLCPGYLAPPRRSPSIDCLFGGAADTAGPSTHRHRPRRRHDLRHPAFALPRAVVAAHVHVARRRQRSALHADHLLRDLPLPRGPDAQHPGRAIRRRSARQGHRRRRGASQRAARGLAEPAGPRAARAGGGAGLSRPHPARRRRRPPPSSRSARSPTSTTSAPPGSTTPTATSTPPSPPPAIQEPSRHLDKALALLQAIRAHRIEAVQPPHWTIEMLAVIARMRPRRVAFVLGMLGALPFSVTSGMSCHRRAADLAISREPPSLRHALITPSVALEEGATLVTADEAYFNKAKGLGGNSGVARVISRLDVAGLCGGDELREVMCDE